MYGSAANVRGAPRVIPFETSGKEAAMVRLTLIMFAALLATAAPAGAGTAVGNPGDAETRTICAFPDVCKTGLNIPDVTVFPH
jgi:hypothetical protein